VVTLLHPTTEALLALEFHRGLKEVGISSSGMMITSRLPQM